MSSAVPTAPSSSSSKPCYNSDCKDLRLDRSRKGWRLRTGDFAELCDRCASAYEEGRFCETFHLNASGWRCCESCGKRVHCGCIVSAHAFTLLDPGGIECMTCARKNVILPLNSAWPPSLLFQSALPDRLKDLSVKNWSQLAGSGPVPWRQAPSMFNSSLPSGELHHRAPYEVDISAALNKLNTSERLPISLEKRKNEDFSERFLNGSLKQCGQDIRENGTAGGIKCEDKPSSCSNMPQPSSFVKEDSSTTQYGLNVSYAPPNEPNGRSKVSGTHLRPTPPSPLPKQIHTSLQNGADPSNETQLRNGRPKVVDTRGRNYLLPRYWPRFTDQELQQISVDSNSVITPLFEKMLSASDAGRIGRLVLPKKCAEAYFPSISQPEGLPLKVQDAKGKEWIFQFRFWPNNNSRMYVLEGVTPCIQSMQLQAGDIVTFSRLEPEGKLVMGFRKASTAADQENEANKIKNGVPVHGDVSSIKVKAELADPWTKVDKSGYIAKEVLGAKPSISRKRKNSTLGSKSKRLRIENEDMIELKITWEEAQGLLRPHPNQVPNIVVIEGFEFEEYEDAPVLGMPTIIPPDNTGESIQWTQCEDCLKWRKMPLSALLPSKWTCSDNSWDPERSFCSAAQELSTEQLEELLSPSNSAAAVKKMKAAKLESDNVEALEGLDTLANLAILGEGEASQAPGQATTKHPRHRPGCSCIVCIQPPSGKGPKHKQTCTCTVCQTVKRRFRTLMLRREKKQSEKEAETTRQRHQFQDEMFPDRSMDDESLTCSNTSTSKLMEEGKLNDVSDEDPNRNKPSTSPFKGQIDLNMQPEREEELSPGSEYASMVKILQVSTGDRFVEHQRSNSGGTVSSSSDPLEPGGEREHKGENSSNVIDLSSSNIDAEKDHPATLSLNASASMSATG